MCFQKIPEKMLNSSFLRIYYELFSESTYESSLLEAWSRKDSLRVVFRANFIRIHSKEYLKSYFSQTLSISDHTIKLIVPKMKNMNKQSVSNPGYTNNITCLNICAMEPSNRKTVKLTIETRLMVLLLLTHLIFCSSPLKSKLCKIQVYSRNMGPNSISKVGRGGTA